MLVDSSRSSTGAGSGTSIVTRMPTMARASAKSVPKRMGLRAHHPPPAQAPHVGQDLGDDAIEGGRHLGAHRYGLVQGAGEQLVLHQGHAGGAGALADALGHEASALGYHLGRAHGGG